LDSDRHRPSGAILVDPDGAVLMQAGTRTAMPQIEPVTPNGF